jgi:transcription elongation factor Elf1
VDDAMHRVLMPNLIERIACPVCGHQEFFEHYRSPYGRGPVADYLSKYYDGRADLAMVDGGQYILLECRECSLIFQKFVPDDQLSAAIYGEWIDLESVRANKKKVNLSLRAATAQDILQMLAYLQRPPNEVKVLDHGMGWGWWLLMARAFGCPVYGYEISPEQIEHGRRNGISPIKWEDIPGSDFDIVNVNMVLEHVADPVGILKHLRTGLAKNGIIRVVVPSAANIRTRLKKMDWRAPKSSRLSLNPVAPLEHLNCYRWKSLKKLGDSAELLMTAIPLSVQYRYTTAWGTVRDVAKNLGRPLARNIFKLHNTVYYRLP